MLSNVCRHRGNLVAESYERDGRSSHLFQSTYAYNERGHLLEEVTVDRLDKPVVRDAAAARVEEKLAIRVAQQRSEICAARPQVDIDIAGHGKIDIEFAHSQRESPRYQLQ